MRITTEQLARHLKRALAPLYIVYGDEPLLALEAADRIRARAREEGHIEREVLTAEQHFDWSHLRISGQSQSLFASRRILEIRIPSGKPGIDGSQALQEYAAHLPPDTVTLIALPEVDWRAQKGAWFGALDAAGVMIEAAPVKRDKLPAWLAGRLEAQEQTADAETLEFIADKVEGNLLAAYQEVQKLALLFPPGALSFDADQGVGAGRRALRRVRSGRHRAAATRCSSRACSTACRAKARRRRSCCGRSPRKSAPSAACWRDSPAAGRCTQALRDARIWGARQQVIERNVGRFTPAQIEAALVHAARIDRMIKGLARGDVWDELLQLGLRFSRRPAKAA